MEPRNYQSQIGRAGQADASIDMGLRSYMLKVYNHMAVAMVITAVAALGVVMMATTKDPNLAAAALPNGKMLTNFGVVLYTSPLRWVMMFAPLALVFFLNFRVDRMSAAAAQATFWVFAVLIGVSMSTIFLVYTSASIVQTFFVTAAAFGALSLYGYTTKRDLTGMGTFLFMGLIGLILAMIVNLFLQSSALQFAVSAAGVLIFAGLTAYDTQKIKEMYYELDDSEVMGKKAIMGALNLYLDFINMFQFLLSFMGNRD